MGEYLKEDTYFGLKKIVDSTLGKLQMYKDSVKSFPDRDSKFHDIIFAELREILKFMKSKVGEALYAELADIPKVEDEEGEDYETPGGPESSAHDMFYDLKLSLAILMSLLTGDHSKKGSQDMKIALETLQLQMDKKQKILYQKIESIDDIKDQLKAADKGIQKSLQSIDKIVMDQTDTQKYIQDMINKINDIDFKVLQAFQHTTSKRKPMLAEILRRMKPKVLDTRFKFGELIYGPQPLGIAPRRDWKQLTLVKSGEIYEGEWKKGTDFIEGKGISIHEDGTILEGWFKNDLFHGEGRTINPDGSAYDGEWKEGKKHGKGLMTYPTGDRYMGEYVNGKKEGRGIYTWPNGNEYDGEFLNGVSEGKGVYYYADGSKYDGQWKDDKKHGMGLFTFVDGTTRKGWWDKGEPYQWMD